MHRQLRCRRSRRASRAAALEEFYALFAATEKTVTVYSQGVNQSSSGTDKVNAIINCHLATGRIGKPGMGPFSVTGQPNAMGGREVGGLANTLAAHMDIENPAHRDRVQRFWQSPRIATQPGLKAVDMFRAVADGRIKALWIMATNPVVSMPDADHVEAAIRACPFVVVSDVTAATDTVASCACAFARRRLGREGRHRHEFGAAHLAAEEFPAAARRSPPRLVDRFAKSPSGWVSPERLRLRLAVADFRRTRRAVGLRERRHARFRHWRLCRD